MRKLQFPGNRAVVSVTILFLAVTILALAQPVSRAATAVPDTVSSAAPGAAGDPGSWGSSISADGNVVALSREFPNFPGSDGYYQVYRNDLGSDFPLTLESITPDTAPNEGTCHIEEIAGTGFYGTPTVKLKKAGETDITATNVNVFLSATSPGDFGKFVPVTALSCDFGLDGAVVGAWDLYLENPDGINATLTGAFDVTEAPQKKPVVESVEPPEGPPGATVTVNGANFGEKQGSSYVTFNGVEVTEYLYWSETRIIVVVPEGAKSGPVRVVTPVGGSNADREFTVEGKPLGSTGWLVVEGSTAEGFETYVLMQNPNDVPAPTAVAFATENGLVNGTLMEVPPNSRMTLRLEDYVSNEWSVSTLVASEVPIVVERSMYWDSKATPAPDRMKSGHANLGVPAPMTRGFKMDAKSETGTDQYFAEGSTAGFDTWILLFNPNQEETEAHITLMDESGPVVEEDVRVGPLSRKTVHLNKLLPDANQVATRVESEQFVVSERSMYWDPDASDKAPCEMTGGHSTAGSPAPSREWFLAEGSTAEGFETYILVQNPQETEAPVTLTFMNSWGVANQATATMPPLSRSTFRISDYVPDDFQVSTRVSSKKAVIAERSMYWDKRKAGAPSSMKDGHSTVGETGTARTWMVPEGSTGGGFSTFILIANTEDAPAEVTVTFMTEDGPLTPTEITVPPTSRYTLCVGDYLTDAYQVSTLVQGNRELVVERSMYWDTRRSPAPFECRGGHSANGLDP